MPWPLAGNAFRVDAVLLPDRGRILTLPPARGLQAASASERQGRNDGPVGLSTMKRRKRRAPTGLQPGAVARCAPGQASFLFRLVTGSRSCVCRPSPSPLAPRPMPAPPGNCWTCSNASSKARTRIHEERMKAIQRSRKRRSKRPARHPQQRLARSGQSRTDENRRRHRAWHPLTWEKALGAYSIRCSNSPAPEPRAESCRCRHRIALRFHSIQRRYAAFFSSVFFFFATAGSTILRAAL